MYPLTIHQTLSHYGDVDVVIASDRQQRSYMAVAANGDNSDALLFVEIDRVTLLELERGEVELYTIMTERALGQVFESSDFVREDPIRTLA